MTNPYRDPGEVVSPEQRRELLWAELSGLYMINAHGRSPEDLRRMRVRIDEIQRLLAAATFR